MKKKTALDIFFITICVLTMAFFLETMHTYWAIASAFILGMAITLSVISTHSQPVGSRPDMVIRGPHSFRTHAEAMRYGMKGWKIIKTYNKRKWKWFGEMIYYVELLMPQPQESPPIEDENEMNIDGYSMSYRKPSVEPTDEELIEQQRFEELAERQKKRNNKS